MVEWFEEGGRRERKIERERERLRLRLREILIVLKCFDSGFMSLYGMALTQLTRPGRFLELSSSPNSVSFRINFITMLMM